MLSGADSLLCACPVLCHQPHAGIFLWDFGGRGICLRRGGTSPRALPCLEPPRISANLPPGSRSPSAPLRRCQLPVPSPGPLWDSPGAHLWCDSHVGFAAGLWSIRMDTSKTPPTFPLPEDLGWPCVMGGAACGTLGIREHGRQSLECPKAGGGPGQGTLAVLRGVCVDLGVFAGVGECPGISLHLGVWPLLSPHSWARHC